MNSTETVYLLSHYDEYGSEEVVATTDRGAVVEMLEEFSDGQYVKNFDGIREKLQGLLDDENLTEARDPINLTNGWGGVQLHVVPLRKKEQS